MLLKTHRVHFVLKDKHFYRIETKGLRSKRKAHHWHLSDLFHLDAFFFSFCVAWTFDHHISETGSLCFVQTVFQLLNRHDSVFFRETFVQRHFFPSKSMRSLTESIAKITDVMKFRNVKEKNFLTHHKHLRKRTWFERKCSSSSCKSCYESNSQKLTSGSFRLLLL